MKYILVWLLSINLIFADELPELKNKADEGDLTAQLELGNCYAKGVNVEQNYEEAAKWYELAAAQGDPEAQTELATLYDPLYEKYNRSMVPLGSNSQKARALYEKAAEQKYAKAQGLLGAQYLYNSQSKEEKKKAITLFRFAANKGDAQATRELAQLYSSGNGTLGINKNEQTAYKLDLLAARKGDPISQGSLAYYLLNEKIMLKQKNGQRSQHITQSI
ncbi:MAG: tetratricopeptide repeat protein [Wohlfahrtiimonas sp.]